MDKSTFNIVNKILFREITRHTKKKGAKMLPMMKTTVSYMWTVNKQLELTLRLRKHIYSFVLIHRVSKEDGYILWKQNITGK